MTVKEVLKLFALMSTLIPVFVICAVAGYFFGESAAILVTVISVTGWVAIVLLTSSVWCDWLEK